MNITTHPYLWDPPPEYSIAASYRILKEQIDCMLRWNRKYRHPDHHLAEDKDMVSDSRYDFFEDCVRRAHPDHPILSLVGWEDSYWDLCMNWVPKAYQELDIQLLENKYPELPWRV